MVPIKLIKPGKCHESMVADFLKEHLHNGETDIHGGALIERSDYNTWLKQLSDNSDKSTVDKGWVVSSTFFAVSENDNMLIGIIDIRHELNDFLAAYGGHIGFGVRPSERNKGYATQMLGMALEFCRNIGLNHVMLSCYKDNPASRKTILKCNGILKREFLLTDADNIVEEHLACYSDQNGSAGKIVQVFWINL